MVNKNLSLFFIWNLSVTQLHPFFYILDRLFQKFLKGVKWRNILRTQVLKTKLRKIASNLDVWKPIDLVGTYFLAGHVSFNINFIVPTIKQNVSFVNIKRCVVLCIFVWSIMCSSEGSYKCIDLLFKTFVLQKNLLSLNIYICNRFSI